MERKAGGEGGRRKGWWGIGGWGNVSFLSRAKETLIVNLASKQINLTSKQIVLLCSTPPFPLTVHTIPEFPKLPLFMKGQRWKHVVVEGRRRR